MNIAFDYSLSPKTHREPVPGYDEYLPDYKTIDSHRDGESEIDMIAASLHCGASFRHADL